MPNRTSAILPILVSISLLLVANPLVFAEPSDVKDLPAGNYIFVEKHGQKHAFEVDDAGKIHWTPKGGTDVGVAPVPVMSPAPVTDSASGTTPEIEVNEFPMIRWRKRIIFASPSKSTAALWTNTDDDFHLSFRLKVYGTAPPVCTVRLYDKNGFELAAFNVLAREFQITEDGDGVEAQGRLK